MKSETRLVVLKGTETFAAVEREITRQRKAFVRETIRIYNSTISSRIIRKR